MPFSFVKSKARTRFSEVRANLEFIESQEPNDPTVEASIQVKVMRGLYYVHLYAALEKTVTETVEQSLLLIKNDGVLNKHYKTEFNVVSLNPKMQGFKAAGYKAYFEKSIEIFAALDAEESSNFSNTMFALNLQNVWCKTLQEVLRCFGIPALPIEPRLRVAIDEVVDKRNAVAHGGESPVVVGERYRADVLRLRTQEIQLVVDLFIDALEAYIATKDYIKPNFRANYVVT